MSESVRSSSEKPRFSLRHLLTLTTFIAIGVAVGLAYQLNRSLTQQREQLLALSNQFPSHNENEFVSVAMPTLANHFESWHVHIPPGQDYELRFGIGEVSANGIPTIVGSIPIPEGKHRVTLYSGDSSSSDEYRYLVYLDGTLVIEKTMGKQWLPNGWSSASGIDWPGVPVPSSPPLQLAGKSYEPRRVFERQQDYFNGQGDEYVTRPGYRLWIDRPNAIYNPPSPFMGFAKAAKYSGWESIDGVGLRDGIRFRYGIAYGSSPSLHQWMFTSPTLATRDALLRVETEFVTTDGTVLSRRSRAIESWQIRNAATGTDSLKWQEEPTQTAYTAFVHAVSKSVDSLLPVVEMKWDIQHPDAVGLRLANTPANEGISHWRLRVLDGGHHLWREIQIGDRPWVTPADTKTGPLELGDGDVHLQWQTDESLPLQIVQRKDGRYVGEKLYQGLPVTFHFEIPSTLQPKLSVDVINQDPSDRGTEAQIAPVFGAIQIELEAKTHDWIWLGAKQKE